MDRVFFSNSLSRKGRNVRKGIWTGEEEEDDEDENDSILPGSVCGGAMLILFILFILSTTSSLHSHLLTPPDHVQQEHLTLFDTFRNFPKLFGTQPQKNEDFEQRRRMDAKVLSA
jgi:hypothetical protein